jgi:hypothetical protein
MPLPKPRPIHGLAANNSLPDHPIAYLRKVFASHRGSVDSRGRMARLAGAEPSKGWRSSSTPFQPLTERRQIEIVSDFLEHGEWFPKLRDTLGPAPGDPGCRIASDIIERARELVRSRMEQTLA